MSENGVKRNETTTAGEFSVTMTRDELERLALDWIAREYGVTAASLTKAAKSGDDLALTVEVRRGA